jgi:hypothetical protein
LDDLTFAFLRSALGNPARTFSYASSGMPDVRDHVWRCGCAAREKARLCALDPCAKHRVLRRDGDEAAGVSGGVAVEAAGGHR